LSEASVIWFEAILFQAILINSYIPSFYTLYSFFLSFFKGFLIFLWALPLGLSEAIFPIADMDDTMGEMGNNRVHGDHYNCASVCIHIG
jgi:hypothetical protein